MKAGDKMGATLAKRGYAILVTSYAQFSSRFIEGYRGKYVVVISRDYAFTNIPTALIDIIS